MLRELVIVWALECAAFMVVLCVAGLLMEYRDRRRSHSPPRSIHSLRSGGGPAGSPPPCLTMDEEERRRRQFEAAMARCQAELEATHRYGQVTRPIHATTDEVAIDALINETVPPRRSAR